MTDRPQKASNGAGRRRVPRWFWFTLVGVVLGLALLAAAGAVVALVKPGLWQAYTDGLTIYLRADDAAVRRVAWEPPITVGGKINETGDNVAGGLSQTGRILVFSRRLPDKKDADLYIARFDGEKWSDPEPLKGLNTEADELGPTLSRNEKCLFFHSDRPGGLGGHDIYVSYWDGQNWGRPFNLGDKINTEFDECDPALSPAEDQLYFSSNRPKTEVTPEQRQAAWKAAMADRTESDYDIFVADNFVVPKSENPLRNVSFRKQVITELGGSPETERAVEAALGWLTRNQEADGHWSMAKHGGVPEDVAGTGFAILAYCGWGAKHTEPGPYQEPLSKAVKWLADLAQKQNGVLSQNMYAHGIGTFALAEAHSLTKDKDPSLREPLQKAIDVILRAQHPQRGGWRYTPVPQEPDTSVVGWQVMALWSARHAGINVPEACFDGVRTWMKFVGGGAAGGLYGYQSPGASSPAMVAEGMFIQQLLGARPDEARQKESAQYIAAQAPAAGAPTTLYFWYYASLALYQHQGPEWTKWNDAIKPLLLTRQEKDGANAGSWTESQYQFGRVMATAGAALGLEVYYRYLPLYEAGGGAEAVKKTVTRTVDKPEPAAEPTVKAGLLVCRHVPELSSASADRTPAFSPQGDFIYFSSDRPGGRGGLDIYRCRLMRGEFQTAENLGAVINTGANETDPSLASQGFEMVFCSDREQQEHHALLYRTLAREVMPVTDLRGVSNILSSLNRVKWWIVGLLLGLAALIALVLWFVKHAERRQVSLLAKCLMASMALHALILVLCSVWMIGAYLQESMGKTLEISADAAALASERLALSIREQVNEMPTSNAVIVRSDVRTMEIPDIEPVRAASQAMATAQFKINPADLMANVKEIQKADRPEQSTPVAERAARFKFKAASDLEMPKAEPVRAAKPQPVAVEPVTPQAKPDSASELARANERRAPEMRVADPAADVAPVTAVKPPDASPRAPAGSELKADVPDVPAAPTQQPAARVRLGPSDVRLEAAQPGRVTPAQATAPLTVEPVPATIQAGSAGNMAQVEKPQALNLGSTADMARSELPVTSGMQGLQPGDPSRAIATARTDEASLQSPAVVARGVKFAPAPQLEAAQKGARTGAQSNPTPFGEPVHMAGGGSTTAGNVTTDKAAALESAARMVQSGSPVIATTIVASVPSVSPGADSAPALHGPGTSLGRMIPRLRMDARTRLEAPTEQLSNYALRTPNIQNQKELIKRLGGDDDTEAAVGRALDWLVRCQEADGSWSCSKWGGQAGHDNAASGFAMLCFFGKGAKHTEKGPYQAALAKAVTWLISRVGKDGDLTAGVGNGMYDQGIATMALAEAYGLTKDPALLDPLKRAVDFIIKAQSQQLGGWRYRPGEDADTSVTGWQVMALVSAQMAGLDVPEKPFELARAWFDRVGAQQNKGLYGYTNANPTPTMTAEGMFCQQLMGVPPTHPRMQEAAAYLKAAMPNAGAPDYYYWYYGCLSLYQHQGPIWEEWNAQLKKIVIASQVKDGEHSGSWAPDGRWTASGGRVVSTAMATLSLEVYYRYLPMYTPLFKPAAPASGTK